MVIPDARESRIIEASIARSEPGHTPRIQCVDLRDTCRHDSDVIERAIFLTSMSVLCALPLTAACEGAPTSAPIALRARLEFDTGESRAVGLLALDLDGDGTDELVSLLRGPGAIQVVEGLSNRPDRIPRRVTLEVGDFAIGPVRVGAWKPGRDGGPAIVAIAQREDPAIVLVDVRALYLGKSEPIVGRTPLQSRPRALAAGDLELDGSPQIAVVNLEDELLLVSDGVVSPPCKLLDAQTTCVHFTADGKSLLVGSQATRKIVRYMRSSLFEFAATGEVQLAGLPRRIDEVDGWRGTEGPTYFVAAGDHDLVRLGADLRVLGTDETAAVPIDLAHTGVARKRSLLAVSVHGQKARIEREDGSTTSFYAGQHPVAATFGDFDGDGHVDTAFANGDAKRISVAFGRADGGFDVARTSASGRSPQSIDVADLDRDGRPDVVALCAQDGTIRVHRGTADGLSDGVSQGFAEGANRVSLRDIDRDGHLDAVFLREMNRNVVLDAWFGDGTGRLWLRGETKPLACATFLGDLLVEDVDGDGMLDAVISDPSASKVALVRLASPEKGRVEFGAPTSIDVPGSPNSLAWLGVGDQGRRIAVGLTAATPAAGVATLAVERGTLVLRDTTPMEAPARSIAFGSSGDIAYVGGGESTGSLSLLLDLSEDTIGSELQGWAPLETSPTGLRAYAVRMGDLDGDGHDDVVVSAQNSHHLNVWLSRPTQSASQLLRLPDIGVGTGPLDLRIADMDGDKVPEIVVACAFSDEIVVVKLR